MNATADSGAASVPQGLVSAVVNLVGTGPVHLGAYTVAELTAVDAIVDFLEARPSEEVLAEAVRSLAARELLVSAPDTEQVQVRGDLGIAVAFQQRARRVLDARVTGTAPGEPWRMLLLPQPEPISLLVRIDALGVHELGLYTSEQAMDQLCDWLPGGSPVDPEDIGDADSVLASADRTALVSFIEYTAQGSAETAGASTDLLLAQHDDDLHSFARDPVDRQRLVAQPLAAPTLRDTVADLLGGR
jgi:hypothetical protein